MSDPRETAPGSAGLERLNDIGIDTSKPHPARIYDYLLGGRNNFQADRDAAEKIEEAIPTARAEVRANREFLGRAVTYAAEQGITQFLDIGTGVPTVGPTHEVAQRRHPSARVAYVDNDPIVLAHSRALLSKTGETITIQADVREPDKILGNEKVQAAGLRPPDRAHVRRPHVLRRRRRRPLEPRRAVPRRLGAGQPPAAVPRQ